MKNQNFYQQSIRVAPFGYACYQIIRDDPGNPCNFKAIGLNDAFERLTGHNKEDILGNTLRVAFPDPETSFSGLRSLFDKVAAENAPAGMEYYFAETGRWLLVNAWHTDPSHIAVTLNDITAGRQSIEAGCLKEVQQHAFWDNNLFGVMIADKNGNYVDANDEVCRMTGYSCEELKSMNVLSLIDREKIEDARIHFEQILKTGRAYGELAYFSKNGEKRWWNVVATRLSDDYFLGLHEDITSRKQMELELSQKVELNKKLLASIPDIVIQTNLEGVITFINEPEFIDYPFITSEQLIGRNILSFVAPSDLDRMEENVRLMFEKPLGIKEYALRFGDMLEIICEANGDVLRDEHGNPTGMVFVIRDITNRKKAEKALAESEERFRLMIKNISAIIVTIDKDGIQQFVSPVAEKITGYTQEELTGKSISEVIHPDDLPQVIKAWEEGTGNPNIEITVRYRHIHKTKGWVYLETVGQSFLNEPAVNAVIAIVHDITERKQAEEDLKENELKFRTLYENSGDAIFIMKGDTFIDCNLRTLEVYGCQTRDQILGHTPFEFSPAVQPDGRDSRDYALEIIAAANTGQTQFFEWAHTKLDGTPFTAEVKLNKLELNGQKLLQAIVRDIRERKQAEAELLKTQNILAEKEAQYRILAENSQDLIYVYCLVPKPHYEYISPSCFQLTGYLPEEGYADPFTYHKFINTPEGIEKFTQFLFDPDQPKVIEEEWLRKDGKRVWVEQMVSRNFDANGNLISFQSTVRDITERNRSEEVIRTERMRLAGIIEGTNAGTWEWNVKTGELILNERWAEIIGYSLEELGTVSFETWTQHAHPDDLKQSNELLGKHFSGELDYYEFESRMLHKNGAWVWVLDRGKVTTWSHDGKPLMMFGTHQDITKRMQAVDELKASERKFRELSTLMRLMTDNMPDMLWAKNLNKEYIFANKAICNNLLSAVNTEEPLGKTDMFFATRERNSQPDNPLWHTFGEICRDSDSITLEELKPTQFDEFGNVKGKFLFLDVHKAPLCDDNGELIGIVGSARDVTAAKETENQLRKLSQAVEQSPAIIIITDPEGKIEYVNPKFCEITGFTPEESKGHNYSAFSTDEMPESVVKELWKTINAGNEWKGEFHNKKKNGELYWESVSISPIYNNEGTITNFLAVKEDITQRKSTDLEVERNRAELKAIYENAPVMMAVIDQNRNLLFANPAFTNFTGVPEAELIGGRACGVFGCINAFDDPQGCGFGSQCKACMLLKSIEDSFLTGKTHKDIEYNTTLKCNNTLKEISLIGSTAPINFAGKSLLLLSFVDISDRKHTESQLRKLSQAVEQSPASVVITNLDGTIEYVNPKFTEITGYTPEEAIGQKMSLLKSGKLPDPVYAKLWKTISSGRNWKGELHNKKKNGEYFWEFALISPIKNEKGEISHYLAVKEDITERKALEERLNHQTRLRELLMEISSGFINIPLEKVDEAINDALAKMAQFVHADRSYTFDYDWENDICNNIFEWCEEGISAEINNLQQVPLAMMQDWVEAHKKGEPMYVPDVFALPHGAVRDILEPQGIKSVLSVPMMNENQCIGFVGFDSVREHHEYTSTEVHLLRVFAQSLANIKLRKEMVEQLLNAKALAEESEEKHRSLIEQMLEGLVVDDGNGIILFANPMFCKMTGYSENELLGKSAYELLLQKHDIEKVRMKDDERKRNITDQYELDVITKSGEVHTFYFHATPVLDKKGNVTASMSTVTDITERKRDQEKIRITKDTYESIFNSVSEAIYVLDENGYFIDVNRGAEIMYGFNREELIGKSPAEITAPGVNDLDLVMKTIQEVRETGISRSFEFWGQRKNSEIFPKDVNLNRGKYFGKDHIIATARDITERKRGDTARIIQYNIARSIHTSKNAADLLETIRQELGQLFDTTNFFVARYNPEKDTLRQLIFCDEMDSFDEWDANQSISGQVVKSGKTIFLRGDEVNNFSMHHNLEMLGTDSACWLGVPVVMHNRPGGVMVIQHYTNPDAYSTADVALFEMIAHETGIFLEKQIMIEDLISAKEKAEESNRLKTAFMDNISHEVRTPLNGILGFGDVLMDETTDRKDKLEYYQFIKHSSERLMQTIADIMNISQLKAGTLKPNITDVQVKQVMHQCFEKTKTACATKNILVTMDLPEDLENLHLMTDQEIFELTMNHLLSNAEKFTQQGRITFGVKRDGGYARFYVKDTGQGIAPEKLEVIFEPFMQEDNSTTRGHEGSGLGLAIARGMAELLGGKIWVESEKIVGSTFFFTLPLSEDNTITDTKAPEIQKPKTDKPLILIAEDDHSNYLYFKAILQKKGYTTLHVFNGAEAVEFCHKFPEITLVLMDIKMPVMNGIEATKKIREFRPDLPIIATTAYAQTGEKHRILSEGCNEYLAKPIMPSDILAMIKKYS